MPEPRGDVPDDEGVDAGSDTPAHRGALDVPEWVSEMRRLYVEPKTRARMREEGVIAPQKRQRGLAGVRARRSAVPPVEAGGPVAPALPVVPAAVPEPGEHSQPEVVTPDERTGGVPLPTDGRDPAPLDGGERAASVHSPQPPGALGDDTGAVAPAAGAGSAPAQPTGPEDVSAWLTSYLSATGHGTQDEEDRNAVAPDEQTSEADVEEPPLASTEHEEVPVRSLAELAGLVEPDEGWPQPFGRAATPPADGEAHDPLPGRPDTSPADAELHDPLPGRPDTSPAATLSPREAEVLDVSVPRPDTEHEVILVEPPSQAGAQSRVRRWQPDPGSGAHAGDDTADPGDAAPPSPVAVVAEVPSRTRASARAAGSRSGKRRRLLVLVLSLVVLAVVAAYLLLAGPGAAAG